MSHRPQLKITAPSYGELFRLVQELRDKIKILEATSVGESSTGAVAGSSTDQVAGSSTDQVAGSSMDQVTGSFTSPVAVSSTDQVAGYFTSSVAGSSTDPVDELSTEPVVKSSTSPVAACEGSISDQWYAMTYRFQGGDETPLHYYYDKARLCQALRLPFSEVREYIIQGIRSPALFTYVMSRPHSDTSELLADLTYWENMNELRQNKFGLALEPTEVGHGMREPLENTLTTSSIVDIKPDLTELPKPQVLPSFIHPTETYCNSHDLSYITGDCPKPQQPKNEYQGGHSPARCTQQQPQCSDQALPSYAPSSTEKANPFVESVQLNGEIEVGLNKSFNEFNSETEPNIPIRISPQTIFKEKTTNNSRKGRVRRALNYLRDYI